MILAVFDDLQNDIKWLWGDSWLLAKSLIVEFYLTFHYKTNSPKWKALLRFQNFTVVLRFTTKEFVLLISILSTDKQEIRAFRLLNFHSKNLGAFVFYQKAGCPYCSLSHSHWGVFPYKSLLGGTFWTEALTWEREVSVFCLSSRFGDDFLELTF